MSLKSCEGESRASFPPSLLEEEDPGPWAQRPQNTSSTDQELLSSLGLSCKALVASGCLPFFRTCQWLPALQPEVCADQGGQTARQEPLEDAAPPSGFFPYYRSEEDTLPSLVLPSQQHWGSQDALSGGETQEDCFCETPVRDGYPAPTSSPGPHTYWPAAPCYWSQQGAPLMVLWMLLSPGPKAFVPQDLCLTTEAPRRSCALTQGLPPPCLGETRSCWGLRTGTQLSAKAEGGWSSKNCPTRNEPPQLKWFCRGMTAWSSTPA
ncbi:PREDICTED: uncharacterized protein LOC102010231 [Chinchilla lanigera]|uniref:uncharacterized protein LOC102010231 n=1 Tax=Chinchilla lanigera TaxID=34839 RepID=UPI00038EFDD9|nr:PREDICTED: uncharacterized protein LOC102010231 [Chinchilla lanigera]